MSLFMLPQLDKVFLKAHTLCRLLATIWEVEKLTNQHQEVKEVERQEAPGNLLLILSRVNG